jgi:hypothetical protein
MTSPRGKSITPANYLVVLAYTYSFRFRAVFQLFSIIRPIATISAMNSRTTKILKAKPTNPISEISILRSVITNAITIRILLTIPADLNHIGITVTPKNTS